MEAQIVLATHNPRLDLLHRQIASLRAQSVADWECLVFDDASVNRDAVVAAIPGDVRFRMLPAREHLGHYLAFEHLLGHTSPDLPVFFCDQDDTWHPNKLERMLATPESAFSAMQVVDVAGTVIRPRFLPRPPTPRALTASRLLLMNSVSGTSLKVTPDVRRLAMPFPAPHLRGWHDQWLAAVAAHVSSIRYLDEVLVDYTQHHDQAVGSGLRQVDRRRIRAYRHRIRTDGLLHDLASRRAWVMAAASRLLEIGDRADPELLDLAAGHFARQLVDGVKNHHVPVARAALLAAGGMAMTGPFAPMRRNRPE